LRQGRGKFCKGAGRRGYISCTICTGLPPGHDKIKKGEKLYFYPSFPFLKRVQDRDEKKHTRSVVYENAGVMPVQPFDKAQDRQAPGERIVLDR
jgi:hypothetical protein